MKIRFLRGLTGAYGHAAPGDVLDLAPHMADALVGRGLAVRAETPCEAIPVPCVPGVALRGLISLVTPTKGRPEQLLRLAAMVLAFAWPAEEREWLILGDVSGDVPPAVLSAGNVRILRPAAKQLGAKRQILAEQAIGRYVLHLDDDDYYGPEYIAAAVSSLSGTAVTAETAAPFIDEDGAVWHYNRGGDRKFAIGATLAYARDVIADGRLAFPGRARMCEDTEFISSARAAGLFRARPASGQYVGTIHSHNTSKRPLKATPWSRGTEADLPRWFGAP